MLTDEVKRIGDKKLYRIRAAVSFGDVKEWDKGGFVQSTENLSHAGMCSVYERAKIKERAWVGGNAEVYGFATITGEAWIGDDAVVSGRQTITE